MIRLSDLIGNSNFKLPPRINPPQFLSHHSEKNHVSAKKPAPIRYASEVQNIPWQDTSSAQHPPLATSMEKDNSERGGFQSTSLEKPIPDIEASPRILFVSAPPRPRHDDITTLPLSRTFSRNSYSSALDEETKRVRRVTTKPQPQTRLPTGKKLLRRLTQSIERSVSKLLIQFNILGILAKEV